MEEKRRLIQFLQDLNTLKQVQEDRGGGEEEADSVYCRRERFCNKAFVYVFINVG